MAIAFEVTSNLALFRRPYTTTSSVSFPVPPPTTVAGLLAAICGIQNRSDQEGACAGYWEQLAGTRMAIQLLSKVRWQSFALNFWNLKEPQKNPHIQIKHQFLFQPSYRIFVHGGIENELKTFLREGHFVFTPYLGVAYALADILYCGEFSWEPISQESVSLATVVPLVNGVEVDVLASGGIHRELLPFQLGADRGIKDAISVLYQQEPKKKVMLSQKGVLDVTRWKDEENIAWFPPLGEKVQSS